MDLVQELAENHSYLNAISTLQQKPIKLSIPDASPSQVKAERAEETIGKVLEEPLGPFFFRKYLSSISCEYLLLFVQEFKQYRSIPKSAREYRLRFLSKIIHKYVKPVNGAEIPMGSLVKHSLLYYYNLIENDNDVTQSSEDVEKANLDTDSLLEELLEISVYQINRDLELSCFQSFIDSKFYRRLVAIRNHQIGILTLDSFLFLRVLGEGGFGRVHAVTKKDTNRAYACKILSKEKVLTKKREPLIKNEREILVNVKHPFIVELKYAFQDDKNLYFILTLATGGDFQFHLRSIGRFPEEWIRFYAAELILVLEYLHSKNILYRDLKPENILLESSGHIKVVDLGLCSYFEPGEQLESRCGTKSYMSPEQACGKYSTATDWWSLGVTILTLLMGKNPFFRKSKKKEEKSLLTGIKSLGLSISAQLKKRNSSGVGSSGKYIKGIPESLDFARSFPLEFNNVELVNKEDRMHRSSKSKELIEGEENALSEEQNPILSPLKINDMKDLDEEFQAISPLLDPQESAFSPQQKKAELLHYYQEVIDRITLPPDSSKQIEDLILGLVCVDPDSRLGRNGAQELKSHPFFAEINWELLKLKCVSPPFIPDPCSVNAVYIEDTKFVNTKSRGSRQYFEGFDYTSPIAFQEEILESVHDENDLLQFRTH